MKITTASVQRGLRGLGAGTCKFCGEHVAHMANHVRWHHPDKTKSRSKQGIYDQRYKAKKLGLPVPPLPRSNGITKRHYHRFVEEKHMDWDTILEALIALEKVVVGLKEAGVR